MGDWFGIGQIVSSGIQAGANVGIGVANNKAAAEREKEARRANYWYNEAAANNADARTRRLYWDLYGPQTQLEQIKAAGLSPSLFYGDGGGISGQAGAQGAGAAGISPTSYGIPEIDITGVAKAMAEIGLIKAQTKKTEEETKTEAGVNDLGKARIENIVAETNNKLLKNVYQEYENALAEIDVSISSSLEETKVKNYIKQTEYLEHIVTSAGIKAEIDENSKKDILDYIKERTNNLIADTLLKRTQNQLTKENVNLTKQQILDLVNQITNRDNQIEINEKTLKAQIEQWGKQNGLKEKEINAMYTGIVVNGVVGGASDILNIMKFAKSLQGTPRITGL